MCLSLLGQISVPSMIEVPSVITWRGLSGLPGKWYHHCICLWQGRHSAVSVARAVSMKGSLHKSLHLASMATLYLDLMNKHWAAGEEAD